MNPLQIQLARQVQRTRLSAQPPSRALRCRDHNQIHSAVGTPAVRQVPIVLIARRRSAIVRERRAPTRLSDLELQQPELSQGNPESPDGQRVPEPEESVAALAKL